MTWANHHNLAALTAIAASESMRRGEREQAEVLYRTAAAAEVAALAALPQGKERTYGITAVSAVALWYKGRHYESAEATAYEALARSSTPAFARHQLRELLGLVWASWEADEAGVAFVSGDVLVSVKGGVVVHGGAPLDLIMRKVEGVQAMLFRTIEMLLGQPLRKKGGVPQELQSMFQPWLFHAPAGSYQFAVRVQEPAQMNFWEADRPKIRQVTETFFDVLRATAGDDDQALAQVVQDRDYRAAFLNLSRNLAPTGKTFERLDLRDGGSPSQQPVSFAADTRQHLNAAIRAIRPVAADDSPGETVKVLGVLRGVHLDKDWLEVVPTDAPAEPLRFLEAGDALDDVVGPMVNRQVIVTGNRRKGRLLYRDIELVE